MAAGLTALLVLAGCGSGDSSVVTLDQKQSADARAPKAASTDAREGFLPLLRRFHDLASWPQAYDITPEQMWDQLATTAGDIVLDATAAEGHVAIVNQCAWALEAVDTVTSDKDTTAVREGLVRSGQLVPGGESFFQGMADEVAVGNLERTQSFVTANTCHEGFGQR